MMLPTTFDVFSALTDSRSGGSGFLQSASASRGWPTSGLQIYDEWDARNKELHRLTTQWMSFSDLSTRAMRATLTHLELPEEVSEQLSIELLEGMVDWPLWPDVTTESLGALGAARLGLLSNIDDRLLQGTAVMRLGVFDPDCIITSQKARAYKPAAALYHRAAELLGPFVHVASSARDVRGAVSAGIPCVRLARPGHSLDASGPTPQWTADSVSTLPQLLGAASAWGHGRSEASGSS
jgi:2-haloacid dehalogenase